MGIHVVVDSSVETERKYPWIGAGHEGLLVLFDSRSSGIVLRENPYYAVGEYIRNDWAEDNFTVFTGTVTLSNDV